MVFRRIRLSFLILIASLFVSVVSVPAWSAINVDIYNEREVVRQNANQRELDNAIETAFKRLLIRVTGVKEILELAEIQVALENGSSYLSSFRFEVSDLFIENILGEQTPTKAMILNFEKATIEALLAKNQLPVWGEKRPEVLVWLGDRIGGQEHILADNEDSELAATVKAISSNRGVPTLYPIMDLEDILGLSFAELFGLFSADIERASVRYFSEAILAGRLIEDGQNSESEDVFKADWLLLFKNERIRLPTASGTLDEVIEMGFDMVARRLAQQYATLYNPNQIGSLSLKIVNIGSLDEFSDVERYLNTLNMITQITIRELEGSNVSFDVKISGDQQQLADILALDERLMPEFETSLESKFDNVLLYKWQAID